MNQKLYTQDNLHLLEYNIKHEMFLITRASERCNANLRALQDGKRPNTNNALIEISNDLDYLCNSMKEIQRMLHELTAQQ